MEADPSRYNPQGEGLANRLWSFTAPVAFAPSPSGELSIRARMKCSKPYWDATDAVQQENWETVARPYLKNKLDAIVDVLNGINVKRYQHYEGSLHFIWLKLDLAPYEIRVRLDADAEDNDFIPDVLAWVDKVRELLNSPEFKAFEAEGEEEDSCVTVFVPSREEAAARRALRNTEAEAFAAWTAAQKPADEAEAAEAAESDVVEAATAAEPAEEAATPAEKPALAGALEIRALEFIKHSGASKLYSCETASWAE